MVAGVVLDPFGVVDEGGGDDDDEEEDEEHEFVSARLERVDEDLQSGGVARVSLNSLMMRMMLKNSRMSFSL